MLSATPLNRPRILASGLLLFLSVAWLSCAAHGEEGNKADASRLRQKGDDFEQRGQWLEACRCYEEAYRKDRIPSPRYRNCLRRLHLAARHRDPAYAATLARLDPGQALDIYQQILSWVSSSYVDRDRASLANLFQSGLDELRFALEDDAFRARYLPGARPTTLAAFKKRLLSWSVPRLSSPLEARDQLLAVVRAGQKDGVPLRPALVTVFGLEFAAGACNALDEYSSFISPGHLALVHAALRGKLAGVGVELTRIDGKLVVGRVYPKGPAEGLLQRLDRLLSIAGHPVEHLRPEEASRLLQGKPDSLVEVKVAGWGETPDRCRTVKLVRRPVLLPSVEFELMDLSDSTPVGYIRINYFQESTAQEVKEALASIAPAPDSIKGLILDLRGNPGGQFLSSVRVAELFLSEGVIVHGESPHKDFNKPFKVEVPGPVQLPMVVLIDGETASAAEVVAGAIKEGRSEARPGRVPVRLVGQTTYGKGSVQTMMPMERPPLDRLGAGVRVTVAKLLSPTNQPYTGRGIEPHIPLPPEADALIEARRVLFDLLKSPPLMGPMASVGPPLM